MRAFMIICLGFLWASSVRAADLDKPRVFITDSKSWEVSGGFGGVDDGALGGINGGARPQSAEIVKTFNERCPGCLVTMKKDRADYVVLLEHEGGKPLFLRDNKFVVFDKDGDAIKSGSTRSLGNAVKEACAAIETNWKPGKRSVTHSPEANEP